MVSPARGAADVLVLIPSAAFQSKSASASPTVRPWENLEFLNLSCARQKKEKCCLGISFTGGRAGGTYSPHRLGEKLCQFLGRKVHVNGRTNREEVFLSFGRFRVAGVPLAKSFLESIASPPTKSMRNTFFSRFLRAPPSGCFGCESGKQKHNNGYQKKRGCSRKHRVL